MKEDARDEGFVRRIISELPDNQDGIALDVGANHGIYTDLLASKFDFVYAFEPDPNNMKILRERSKASNVAYCWEAIDETDGQMVKLYRSDDPGGSSTNEESPRFGGWGHRWDNYVWVPTLTFDTFWQDYKHACSADYARGSSIRFIKCDVEGAEDYIFDWGQTMLTQNKMQIVLECHQPVNFVRLYDLFDSCGYAVFGTDGKRCVGLRRDAHFLVRNDI